MTTKNSHSLCSNFFRIILNLIIYILSLFLPNHIIELINNFITTLPQDIRFLCCYAKVLFIMVFYEKSNSTIIDVFDQNVRIYPNKPCLIFEGSEWSFKEVELYSRRVAQEFKTRFHKGDVIGLMITNRAQYAPIWLGLSRLGIVSALFNTYQKNKPLVHMIKSARPKAIIFSPDTAQGLSSVLNDIDSEIELYCLGKTTSVPHYTNLHELISNSDPDYSATPKIKFTDTLMYIYTSGSSGLPKPAIFPHYKYLMMASLVRYFNRVTPQDRVYCPLPLYHAGGGVVGTSCAFVVGGTVVIREKFSASSYFKDCSKYNCTIGQYIGEIARYILATPASADDKMHSVRMMMGNGMQTEVWKQMYSRFNIPDIIEYYGSTEGNIVLINNENVVGSCGFIPRFIPLLRQLVGTYIIKVDVDGTPVRDKNGLCILNKPNEQGMIIGMIPPGQVTKQFIGYANNEEANKNKFVYDVLKKGDRAFASGDIMVEDELGYFHFKDRIGDTFRWKGENVATTEVEDVLRGFPKINECTVYGVQIPGTEGRTGMVAIVGNTGDFDFSKLAKYLDESLPTYAQPIFIRLTTHLDYTQTFKAKKYILQKQGFDVNSIKDPIFIRKEMTYHLLTPQMYEDVIQGKIKL